MYATSLVLTSAIISVAAGQMPTYLSPRSMYPSSSSPSISSAALQSLIMRQLMAQATSSSPKRSYTMSSSPTSSRYGLPAASNPSLVAIPLYVRNSQSSGSPAKSRSLYDILSERKVPAASSRHMTYAPKKVMAQPESAGYASDPSPPPLRYISYARYEQPKPASSSYEPVRSFELKNSEAGYGDASSVSLLSGNYGGGQGGLSLAYAPAPQSAPQQQGPSTNAYRQAAAQIAPRLKVVEYDDNQKSALSDFTSALENFELKSITNQDIYDIPVINPPLTRIQVKPKQQQDSYSGQSSGYSSKPTASYAPSASSYDDSPRQSYASAPQVQSAPSYASSSDYSAPATDGYSRDSYRQSDRGSESYRASGTDSYGSSAVYVAPPTNYESDNYRPTSPPSSYSSASAADYYNQGESSAPVPNPDDPNCPYKSQGSPQPNDAYSSSSSSSSASYTSPKVAKVSTNPEANYEADELDPSKLELKIVHLPVSVLKRLVGSGDLALPSFNKKK